MREEGVTRGDNAVHIPGTIQKDPERSVVTGNVQESFHDALEHCSSPEQERIPSSKTLHEREEGNLQQHQRPRTAYWRVKGGTILDRMVTVATEKNWDADVLAWLGVKKGRE